MDLSHLDWPFLDATHRALAAEAAGWAAVHAAGGCHADVDATCRRHVRALGAAGLLRHVVPARFGGVAEAVDSRSVCVVRETLAYRDALADFAFAMQGLGSAPLALAGDASEPLAREWLPRVARGEAIAAFALSEPGAGSDAAALALAARRDGDDYVLDGEKTFISNGGIAEFYVTFARTGGPGADGVSAFLVPAAARRLSTPPTSCCHAAR
jgi:alkylation response protein AidB-like acyl-CoA dehydrogenase